MTKEDIISQLKSLKMNSLSFIDENDPDDIWKYDIEALNITIKFMEDYYLDK